MFLRFCSAACIALLAWPWRLRLAPREGRSHSQAIAATADTPLGQTAHHLRQLAEAPESITAIVPLDSPQEAFAARHFLIQQATHSLDVQYYIWRADTSGLMLLGDLLAAADRGVRVRLLLDDGGTAGMDSLLHTLTPTPRLRCACSTPLCCAGPKCWAMCLTFSAPTGACTTNRSPPTTRPALWAGAILATSTLAIPKGVVCRPGCAGRGPVVRDISHDFDRYWASPSAYPYRAHRHPPLRFGSARRCASALPQRTPAPKGSATRPPRPNSRLPEHLQANDQAILRAPAHLAQRRPGQSAGPRPASRA